MPSCLEFLGYCFSSPSLTSVFVHIRVEINWIPFELLPKNPGLPSSKQLYFSPLIKKIRIAAIPRSLCLSFSPAVSKNHWQSIRSRESNRDVLHAEEFKKKKKNMHPIQISLLLVKNVSCSSTDPKSTDVPPSL